MASSRAEKDNKERQDRYQAVLSALLRDDDNKYCVDCDAKGPRWASWNLGIFMCIRCAGIHRNLGVHISKVKSVTLDSWTPEQIAMVQEMGNSRARAVYEANLPDNFRRPQTDSALEAFIRAKYEQKKYIASEWVPPKPRALPLVVEEPVKDKKIRPRATNNVHLSSVGARTESAGVPPPLKVESRSIKVESHGVKAAEVTSNQTRAPEVDLLGLETPIPAAGSSTSSDDLFSAFCSAPPAASGQGGAGSGGAGSGAELGGDMSLFGNGVEQKQTSSKDAIMALFGPATNAYGGGGIYAPNQTMPMMANQNGMIGMMPGNVQMQSFDPYWTPAVSDTQFTELTTAHRAEYQLAPVDYESIAVYQTSGGTMYTGTGMQAEAYPGWPGGVQMMMGGMPQQAGMIGMSVQGMPGGMQPMGGLMLNQGGVAGGGHVMMGQVNMYGVQQQPPPAMYNMQQVQNQMSSMSLIPEQNGVVPSGPIGYWPSPHMVAPSGSAPPAGQPWGQQHQAAAYTVPTNLWQ